MPAIHRMCVATFLRGKKEKGCAQIQIAAVRIHAVARLNASFENPRSRKGKTNKSSDIHRRTLVISLLKKNS